MGWFHKKDNALELDQKKKKNKKNKKKTPLYPYPFHMTIAQAKLLFLLQEKENTKATLEPELAVFTGQVTSPKINFSFGPNTARAHTECLFLLEGVWQKSSDGAR